MNGCGNSDRPEEYISRKQYHMNENYVDGNICAMVIMMMRGSTKMSWKHDDMRCVCGDVESGKHVLLDCNIYMDVRKRWKEKNNAEHDDMHETIQGYELNNV